MWNRMMQLPTKAYLAFQGFVQELKEDERGLSGIVVAVLLILVAVLAVVALWGFLSGWLDGLFSDIQTKAGGIS